MNREPTCDPTTDRVLTPRNVMLIVIDYRPTQVNSVKAVDHQT
jgi:hypothetical protein